MKQVLAWKKRLEILSLVVLAVLFLSPANIMAQVNWYKNKSVEDFKETKRVSIIFSSQNIKEVTSMFGHTFLVFHNELRPLPSDHTIEFRGVMSKSFQDYYKALAGTLPGRYELNNLLYKQREYSSDSRDLWIYPLNLKKNEIRKLVNNIKLRLNLVYQYSFLAKNCSYFINDVVLESVNKKKSYTIATIPIQSIRSLADEGLIAEQQGYVSPSDYNFFNQLISKFSDERVQNLKDYYHKDQYSFSPENKNEKRVFSKLLNIKVQNTPIKQKRDELYRLKKLYHSTLQKNEYKSNDPINKPGDSYIAVSFLPNNLGNFRTILRPAQRSYISNHIDTYNFSTFEVMKPSLRSYKSQVIIDEINVIKLESILGEKFFFPSMDKYLDLSFYNWSLLKRDAEEKVLRFGLGETLSFKRVAASLIPYAGMRQYSNNGPPKVGSDLGINAVIQFNPSNVFSSRFTSTRYLFSPFNFSYLYKLEASLRLGKNYSSFVKIESTTFTNNKHLFAELGLAYLF